MPTLTAGQELAWRELIAIARATSGAVSVVDGKPRSRLGLLTVTLAVDCAGTPHTAAGIRLADRETFEVTVWPAFPSSPPSVCSVDARFAGQPHVMWSKVICLYASTSDWEPANGMWDVVHRLLTWLSRASRGTLVNPAIPLHPPAVASLSALHPIVVRLDLPPAYEHDRRAWTCFARLERPQSSRHFELTGWHDEPSAAPKAGTRPVVALMIALPEPIDFLYPRTVQDLAQVFARQGVAGNIGRLIEKAWGQNAETAPLILLLGSPGPSGAADTARIAQLAAWHISSPTGYDDRTLDWVKVYDQRPARTIRRDVRRPVSWLRGKRVLILGCGALGAPIAEFCARADVAEIDLVDNALVNPGVLVRQPYEHEHIGTPKADATAVRLARVRPTLKARVHRINASTLTPGTVRAAQLIVDATANRAIAEWLETEWRAEHPLRTAIVSLMVGHDAQLGVATIATPRSTGAGVDLLRRLALDGFDNEDLNDVIDDLYPDPPRSTLFQPEPGCSDPTFTGSAADLAALSARLFNAALAFVATAETFAEPTRAAATAAAVVVRQSTGLVPERPSQLLQWSGDLVLADTGGYEIRIARSALASMRQEAIRATQLDASRREAGGVLLGQIDPACRVVWVSSALGDPPSGLASSTGITMDPRQIREDLLMETKRTRGMRAFIGAWHSHPWGDAKPSDTDLATMDEIVNGQDSRMPTALLLIVGGRQHWRRWLAGTGLPDLHGSTFLTSPSGPRPEEPPRAHVR